ncbi:hypothetical protein JOD24_003411 [Kroppenstedtia sanguinis]
MENNRSKATIQTNQQAGVNKKTSHSGRKFWTILAVEENITFYKEERFQKKLGDLSPVEHQEKVAA